VSCDRKDEASNQVSKSNGASSSPLSYDSEDAPRKKERTSIMATTIQRTIAQTRTFEDAECLRNQIAAQFDPMLSPKNSWGIVSNLTAARTMGHPVFDVVLVGQSQEPLREKITAYLEGLLSQQTTPIAKTE